MPGGTCGECEECVTRGAARARPEDSNQNTFKNTFSVTFKSALLGKVSNIYNQPYIKAKLVK